VVGRADKYHVYIVTGNDIAEVIVSLAVLVVVFTVNPTLGPIEMIVYYVTHRHNLYVTKSHEAAHVTSSLTAHTDASHHDTVIGAEYLRINEQWGSQRSGGTLP
jgi:hypothetical protein